MPFVKPSAPPLESPLGSDDDEFEQVDITSETVDGFELVAVTVDDRLEEPKVDRRHGEPGEMPNGDGIERGALGPRSLQPDLVGLRPDLVRGRLRYEECLERDGRTDPGRIRYCDGPVRALSPLPDSYTRGRQV